MTYGPDAIYRDVSYISYHFHWSLDDVLDLEHPQRQRFVDEIERLNQAAAGAVLR